MSNPGGHSLSDVLSIQHQVAGKLHIGFVSGEFLELRKPSTCGLGLGLISPVIESSSAVVFLRAVTR